MKKVLLLISLFVVSISLGSFTSDPREVAANCKHTGNPHDYCYASDGTHNLKVVKCRPGDGDCFYDEPTPPPPPPEK